MVLGGAYVVLDTWEDADEANATRNAGRILNSRVIDRGVVAAMDALLAQRQPEVLIIGPSYANTDVKPEVLATRLQVPRDKVLLLSVPNSVGSHWYAVLKNRVYGGGHAPKLVVVVSGLQSMLLTTPLTESSFVNLRVHLGDTSDPEIDARVRQTASMRMARMREQRGKVRKSLFDVLRFRPTAMLHRGQGGGPITAGETRGALERVFADENVDMDLHMASMPIVEANRLDERAYTPDMLPSPDDSFIPVITDMVEEHDGRVVWVRPPMSPHAPAHLDDVVLPGVQERTLALLADRAGDFVDMRALPMTSDMFKNEDHMNEEGSRRFSEALAGTLQQLDALEPKARPGLLPPLVAQASLDGQPVADLTVVPAGSTATWSLSEGWVPLRGTFALGFAGRQAEEGAAPQWTVAGAPVAVPSIVGAEGAVRYQLDERLAAPEAAFEVSVSVPAEGSELRIDGLALGRRLGRSFLVGDAIALDGHSAELFGVHQVQGGVLADHTVRPTYRRRPVKVPGRDREVVDLPRLQLAAFDTDRWGFLSDERLIGETHFGSRCSPLRITEDGTELPLANVPCIEVQRQGEGRSCHTTDRIFFAASDATDPALNERTYQLVLDEQRLCDGAVWLYPKDHFDVSWPADRLAPFREGARYFTLGARYLNQRPAKVRVTLQVDGVVRIDDELDGRDFKKGPKVWRLEPPLPADARDVTLTVENLAHVFYLVEEATLSERPPPPR